MAVVPAKRARLNRARASRDPVIHGRRESTNRFDYWIPALARRAMPGSLGRNDRQERELRDNGIRLKRTDRCAAGRTCSVFDRLIALRRRTTSICSPPATPPAAPYATAPPPGRSGCRGRTQGHACDADHAENVSACATEAAQTDNAEHRHDCQATDHAVTQRPAEGIQCC
jgi:hypothetical protein